MSVSVIMVRIKNFFEQNWNVRVGLPIGTRYRHRRFFKQGLWVLIYWHRSEINILIKKMFCWYLLVMDSSPITCYWSWISVYLILNAYKFYMISLILPSSEYLISLCSPISLIITCFFGSAGYYAYIQNANWKSL